MPSTFYTLITAAGAAAIATAIDDGTHVPLTHLAVGTGENDAPYEPVSTQTELKDEVYRVSLQDVSVHPENANWVVVIGVVPPEVGGWIFREVAIFDENGVMFAIAKVPENYKPVLAEGSAADIEFKLVLDIGNADTVQLQVDPSTVYAPKSWVLQQLGDHEASRDHPGGTEAAPGFLQLASVPETLEGLLNSKAVHPEGVAALIDDLLTEHEQSSDHPNATTTVRGFVELATNTEAKTGTDTVRSVTPAGLKAVLDDRPVDEFVRVAFDGAASPLTNFKSMNVSSLVDLGTGHYRINFIIPAADANYVVSGTATDRQSYPSSPRALTTLSVVVKQPTFVEVSSHHVGDSSYARDASIMDVMIHGGAAA